MKMGQPDDPEFTSVIVELRFRAQDRRLSLPEIRGGDHPYLKLDGALWRDLVDILREFGWKNRGEIWSHPRSIVTIQASSAGRPSGGYIGLKTEEQDMKLSEQLVDKVLSGADPAEVARGLLGEVMTKVGDVSDYFLKQLDDELHGFLKTATRSTYRQDFLFDFSGEDKTRWGGIEARIADASRKANRRYPMTFSGRASVPRRGTYTVIIQVD